MRGQPLASTYHAPAGPRQCGIGAIRAHPLSPRPVPCPSALHYNEHGFGADILAQRTRPLGLPDNQPARCPPSLRPVHAGNPHTRNSDGTPKPKPDPNHTLNTETLSLTRHLPLLCVPCSLRSPKTRTYAPSSLASRAQETCTCTRVNADLPLGDRGKGPLPTRRQCLQLPDIHVHKPHTASEDYRPPS